MNIRLDLMTREKMHAFFLDFAYDPDTFENPENCKTYTYDPRDADTFYRKQNRPDRAHFALMLDDEVIGDLYLKQIDRTEKHCVLSIHMKNDSVKNHGYGTAAEQLAIQYAFNELGMETIFADTLIRNRRSRHVLEKAGFVMIVADERFCYYRCDKDSWKALKDQYAASGGSW